MKIYKLLPLILIFVCVNAYGAYTGTMPKDIGTSTPLGSENPNVLDDVDRENRTVQVNLYRLKFVGTDTTLAANDSWVVGSSSTAMLITMPSASSCANSSVTKPFVITNYSTGTITLNVSVDGVGSPTIKGSQTMSLFTDGTRWYEIRAGNAYDSDYLGGVIASDYARSGANSDITAITGLTTYLAVGQGGSGTNTAAGAASAFGVGTEDTPTFTGIVATGSSTLTTVALSNGTVSGNLGISGSVSGLEDADIPNDLTLTNLTQVTTRNYNDLSGTSTISPTTATITSARITSGTVSGTLEITGSVTGIEDADIPNTITLDNLTQVTTRNYNDLSGTSTISPTTATITTINNTNFSGGAGTFTGNVQMASVTGFDYLKQWRIGSIIGTGNVNFVAGLGITFTPTYSDGNGTITVTASGTSSAGGWTYTGTQTIGIAGSEVLPHGTLTLDASYGLVGLTDPWIPNNITLDNFTQITTRNYDDISGTSTIKPTQIAIGTTTLQGALNVVGTATVSGTITAGGFSGTHIGNGSELTGVIVAFSAVTGSATASQLPSTVEFPGTTTAITGTSASTRLYNYKTSLDMANNAVGSSNKLLLRFADGTSTITNSGGASHTFTTTNLTGTSTSLFSNGTSSAYIASGYFDTDAHADFNLGTGTGSFVWDVDFSVDNPAATGIVMSYATDRVLDITYDGTTLQLYLSSDNASWNIADGSSLGVSRYNIVFSANTRYHLEFSWDAVNKYRVYLDGVKIMETTSATTLYSVNGSLRHGANRTGAYSITGKMENIRFNRTTGNSSNFTRPVHYYGGASSLADTYSLNIVSPGTTTPELLLTNEGTATTNRYLLADVTTAIFGLGTTTPVTATTTAYSGWFAGAVRATAFNVASTEKIKENIKPIRIKPDLLDAEGMAKQNYIAGSKSAWIAANQVNYQYVGSDTVTYVDTAAMESDYNAYIELDWASDENRNDYIEYIQKTHEKGFWQVFDSATPKSWNPKDKPTLTRKGFVVEDMPDVVKGDDGQSIDPMALIAYISVVQQTLKADTIFAMSALKELITTGTVTQQKIDYIDDRLEVLNP